METFSLVRDLHRLSEIAGVLIRFGLGDLVRRAGVLTLLERAGRVLHLREGRDHGGLEPAVRARRALETLGPTFVKLGQVLATRVDLFPPAWITEFEKLQNEVPPVPFADLQPELLSAYGPGYCGPDLVAVFRAIDPEPLAAASIAQVHRAELADGTPVVVKIRRPDIRPKIAADLRILGHLARLIESEMPEARRFHPVQIVAQLERSLLRELDFGREAQHMRRFAEAFAADPGVLIPKPYMALARESVNVQEYVAGIPGTDLTAVDAAGLSRPRLAARGADAVLRMILELGFFHADPHPGNVFYLPGERLALVDFGMVGRLNEARRGELIRLLAALVRRDVEGLAGILLLWSGHPVTDEAQLAADLSELLFDYQDVPLKDIRLRKLLGELTAIMRVHALTLPSDLALLFKALLTLEGLGSQLDPQFRMVEHLTPFVEKLVRDRHGPRALARRGRDSLQDVLGQAVGLPRDLARFLRELRHGRLHVELGVERLDHFGRRLERGISRLTLGILTAALVIGSSIVMTVAGGPTLFGLPLFGLVGFVLAFFNSLWLIVSIARSRRE